MRRDTFSILAISCALLALGSGCQDRQLTQPTLVRALAGLTVSDTSVRYYYFAGKPQQLLIDSEYVIVASDGDPVAAASDVLTQAGIEVSGGTPMLQAPKHGLLRLSKASARGARAAVAFLRDNGQFEFVSPAYVIAKNHHRYRPVDRIDVQFAPSVDPATIRALIDSAGLRIIREPKPDSGFFAYVLQYGRGQDPLTVANALDRHPLVTWASGDAVLDVAPASDPNDPYFARQFFLKNAAIKNGVHVDINVEPVWSLTNGAGTHVAVLDDGIDIQQDQQAAGDLHGRLTASEAYGYDLLPGYPGEDAFHPCCNDTHGTAIAGIIAENTGNGIAGAGIAPGAYLSSARIFRHTYPPETYIPPGIIAATANEIADAINWAWSSASADVINGSWGIDENTAIDAAIRNAMSQGRNGKGTVVVFAAGDGSDRYHNIIADVAWPASSSSTTELISVGAIDASGDPANYTPDGAIDLVAPSGYDANWCDALGVTTTDLFGSPGCSNGPASDVNYTETFSGTSATAPQVAAVAALLLAHEPSLTASEVKYRLKRWADWWNSSQTFGAGKLNAYRAVSPPPPPTVSISGPTKVRANVACIWTANPSGSPPYQYVWTKNGLIISQAPEVTTSFASSGTIAVQIWDATGQDAYAQRSILVTGTAPLCSS